MDGQTLEDFYTISESSGSSELIKVKLIAINNIITLKMKIFVN